MWKNIKQIEQYTHLKSNSYYKKKTADFSEIRKPNLCDCVFCEIGKNTKPTSSFNICYMRFKNKNHKKNR